MSDKKQMSSYQRAIKKLAILEAGMKWAIAYLDNNGPMSNEKRLHVLKWLIQTMQKEQDL